ncbi:hypothetical protein [Paenibacillus hamazuiensis]|uniref:hypothetical protein n=1 Tax=Paenibacillus hamazuiensis TaxID=2936508 RepID=UPI00200FF401|nr:hypothetical protein [Paenibacillus hamazuiensis]
MADDEHYKVRLGEGDLHLPVGWREILYETLFAMNSRPVMGIIELKPRFERDSQSCLEAVKMLIEQCDKQSY